MEQMKCILFSDSAVCLPPLSTGGLKLSTAWLNYHKFRLSSGCSQTCFLLWHSVSDPSARDPCQPIRVCAGFKYTRKELVGLVLCHLLHQRAFGTASTFNTFPCGFFTSKKQWVSCFEWGLGDFHRIQLPVFVVGFTETFLCSAFLRSMPQCLLRC